MQSFETANERDRKQFHSSISVVAIGILVLDQHSSLCTAKA